MPTVDKQANGTEQSHLINDRDDIAVQWGKDGFFIMCHVDSLKEKH